MDVQQDDKKPKELFTSEDLLSGDEEAIRKKLNAAIEQGVKERETLPQELQTAVCDAKKAFAVFSDDDEIVREAAESMLEKSIRGMKDRDAEAIRNAAEEVSKKMAKVRVAKENAEHTDEPLTPSSVGGGSAAAAHVESELPKTIEDAEALSAKIAGTFRQH